MKNWQTYVKKYAPFAIIAVISALLAWLAHNPELGLYGEIITTLIALVVFWIQGLLDNIGILLSFDTINIIIALIFFKLHFIVLLGLWILIKKMWAERKT